MEKEEDEPDFEECEKTSREEFMAVDEEEYDVIYSCEYVDLISRDLHMKCKVSNLDVNSLIDSGAQGDLLNVNVFQKLAIRPKLLPHHQGV